MSHLISSVTSGSDGRPMAVDLRSDSSHGQCPVVIFLHGFKGFKDWGHFPMVGDALAEAGFAFVSFNFSNNGTTIEQPTDFADLEAFGNNSYSKELFDLGRIIDGVADGTLFPDTDMDRGRILLLGHSRGGGMAIVKTGEDKRVKGLVTWASVASLQRAQADMEQWKRDGVIHIPNARTGQQMPMYHQFVEDYLANEERFSLEKCCGNISVPSLFIHGTDDGTVSGTDAQQLEKWCATGKAHLIDGGDHTFGGRHPFQERQLPKLTASALEATVAHLRRID